MKNLNIVTGFWNVRKDRSESKYLENFKNVLRLNQNMTIFIPKQYELFVNEHRASMSNKTDIIIVELDEIKNKYFADYWDNLQKIRTDPNWFNSTNWLVRNPQHFSEWYNPIVMSKVFFIYEAYKINKFNSDTFVWVDAGITQHISKEIICESNINTISEYTESILFSSSDYVANEVHGFDYKGFKKYTDIIPNWLCRATIFFCNKNYIEKFKNDYSFYLKDTLERGYMGTEESIFSLLSCVDQITYKRYHTKNNSMPDMFLEKLGNRKKDIIVAAIANYSSEKIKNYVNSINRCGFDGDKVMITYNVSNETIEFLKLNGWTVFSGELVGHPHMKRLIDIYIVLKQLDTNYRYVITTDVRDVVFQMNPSEYLEKNLKKKILISSENVLYKNEPWGVKNILEGYNELLLDRYKDEVTCNVGVIAGEFKEMMDLLLLNYLVSQSGNVQHFTDQSSFNFIIHNSLIKENLQIEGIETNWALQIGTLENFNLIGNYKIQIKNDTIMKDENPFVIVHQYDRNELTKNLYK